MTGEKFNKLLAPEEAQALARPFVLSFSAVSYTTRIDGIFAFAAAVANAVEEKARANALKDASEHLRRTTADYDEDWLLDVAGDIEQDQMV